MNFVNTNADIERYMNQAKSAQRITEETRKKIYHLDYEVTNEIYSTQKINADRQEITDELKVSATKWQNELIKLSAEIRKSFDKDSAPDKDTTAALQTVLQYIQAAGGNLDLQHVKWLLKPIYEALDVKSYIIVESMLTSKDTGGMASGIDHPREIVSLRERFIVLDDRLNAIKKASGSFIDSVWADASLTKDYVAGVSHMAVGSNIQSLIDYVTETKDFVVGLLNFEEEKENPSEDWKFNFKKIW